jgi:hypothetical protein
MGWKKRAGGTQLYVLPGMRLRKLRSFNAAQTAPVAPPHSVHARGLSGAPCRCGRRYHVINAPNKLLGRYDLICNNVTRLLKAVLHTYLKN